jgi:hypothetical protein
MQVICSCNNDRVNVNDVEFLDIEEGPAGEDRMTFVCPICGEDHVSVVLGGGSNDGDAFWSEMNEVTRMQCEAADQIYE